MYILYIYNIYIYIYIYIYICIYKYINFKAVNNVLDAKMVLKTHLFIKIFRLLYSQNTNMLKYVKALQKASILRITIYH